MPSPITRSLLAFQVPPAMRANFAEWQRRAGQADRAVDLAMLHLTLCVLHESPDPDPFLRRRVVAALAGGLPPAAPIRLGRVHPRALGAELVTRGGRAEITAFFGAVAASLRRHDLDPLHRRAGLRPHITLGYDRCAFAAFDAPWTWIPAELLLIDSRPRPGGGRDHVVLHRWPLLPPAQSAFAFMADAPPLRRAA